MSRKPKEEMDERLLLAVQRIRRSDLTAEQVLKKVNEYLEQQLRVLDVDIKRYQQERDYDRLRVVKRRREWTENMMIWIFHNI